MENPSRSDVVIGTFKISRDGYETSQAVSSQRPQKNFRLVYMHYSKISGGEGKGRGKGEN